MTLLVKNHEDYDQILANFSSSSQFRAYGAGPSQSGPGNMQRFVVCNLRCKR